MAALVVCVGLSILSDWANHARLTRRNASEGSHMVSSLGIYILIVQGIAIIWGNDTKALRTGMDTTTRIGDLVVTGAQWITLGVSAALLFAYLLFLVCSNIGLRLRAMADNPVQFTILGYNIEGHRLLAFAISGFLAAVSSLLFSYDIGFDPQGGLDALLLAIVAVFIGGRDSFWGPVLAGILLGIVRAEVIWVFSARWQDTATFALLVLFLFIRPQGILGRKIRLEEQI